MVPSLMSSIAASAPAARCDHPARRPTVSVPNVAAISGGRTLSLDGIVRAAMGSLEDSQHVLRIDTDLSEPQLKLAVQVEPIAHALLNLLTNACRYSSALTRVRVRSMRQWADGAEHLVLTVCDRGQGMSRAHQQRAFDAYWQGPGDRAGPGRGLGLTVARELLEAQGGWLELRSALGIGTEVEMWLPLPISADRSA